MIASLYVAWASGASRGELRVKTNSVGANGGVVGETTRELGGFGGGESGGSGVGGEVAADSALAILFSVDIQFASAEKTHERAAAVAIGRGRERNLAVDLDFQEGRTKWVRGFQLAEASVVADCLANPIERCLDEGSSTKVMTSADQEERALPSLQISSTASFKMTPECDGHHLISMEREVSKWSHCRREVMSWMDWY